MDSHPPLKKLKTEEFSGGSLINLLLNLGARLDIEDDKGRTPFEKAIYDLNYQACVELIEAGAELRPRWNYQHILNHVIKHSCQSIAKLLLKLTNPQTPLTLCADNIESLEFIANCGIDLKTKFTHGMTLLHISVLYRRHKICSWLVDKGFPVDTPTDALGDTPLHIAAEAGDIDLVKILVEGGANLNARDNRGWTPLRWAIKGRNRSIEEYLKAAGAEKPFELPLDVVGRNAKKI